MKKVLYSALIMVAALAMNSCTTYQYSARQTSIQTQNILTTPTLVDVKPDYGKRVEVTSSWCKTKEDALNECKYMAILNNKIDVVVDLVYKLECKKMKMRPYKATLTGYAGYFTNFRTMYEDVDLLKNYTREDIEKYLILHHPEVLKYMNHTDGEVVNIFHNSGAPKMCDKPEQPAPTPAPAPEPAKPTSNKGRK